MIWRCKLKRIIFPQTSKNGSMWRNAFHIEQIHTVLLHFVIDMTKKKHSTVNTHNANVLIFSLSNDDIETLLEKASNQRLKHCEPIFRVFFFIYLNEQNRHSQSHHHVVRDKWDISHPIYQQISCTKTTYCKHYTNEFAKNKQTDNHDIRSRQP